MTDKGFDYRHVLPNAPFIDDASLISFPEQLDFCIRQPAWIKKAVVRTTSYAITPFVQPEWCLFMLSIPDNFRKNYKLYRAILSHSSPDLYSLPTKNRNGRPLNRSSTRAIIYEISYRVISALCYDARCSTNKKLKNLNYIDFDECYRVRDDFRDIADHCILNLEKKSIVPWLDMRHLLDMHFSGEANLSRAIETLISLDISFEYAWGLLSKQGINEK